MLRLTTFGGLALSRDGVALTGAAAQRSRLSLLALLATAGPTGFSRDKLLLYLWPESDEERARHALKQAVYSLRRELAADEVIVGTASLSLNPLLITSDAREFETAMAAGDLAAAVTLYCGPFLDGFHLKDSTEYERWSAEQRARYAHMWVSSVEKLAGDREARGAWREAAGYWRTLAASEPLSGRLALALMRSLAESGDLGAALQQYRVHEALLREEIGSAPEAAVSSFAESLKAGTWTRSPEPRIERKPFVVSAQPTAIEEPLVATTPPVVRGSPTGGPRHSIGSARKRRRVSTALAFVLGVALMGTIAGVTYVKKHPEEWAQLQLIRTRPAAVLAPRQIVVAPFENKTGEERFNGLGEQIADWMAAQLSDADFKAVDSRTARIGNYVVEKTPRPMRPSDDIALGEETQSSYVVVGNYYRQGDSLEAQVRIVDVAARQTIRVLGPFYGSARNPDGLIKTLLPPTVAALAAAVDTSAGGLTLKYSEPPSPEAFSRVNSAWETFFQRPRDTVTVFAELDTAARLDTTYAAPLLMKAYMLDVKSQWNGVNQIMKRVAPLVPEMSKLEKAAYQLFNSDLQGNALKRLEIARQLRSISPGSTEMPLLLVVSSLYVGNVDTAVAALRTVDPKRGMNVGSPTYLEWAATTYHHSGDAALEEQAVREELSRFRYHPPATFQLARIYAARNDQKQLEEVISKGIPSKGDSADVRDPVADRIELRLLAGRELRAHGHPAEAKAMFSQLASEVKPQPATTLEGARRRARVLYEAADYQAAKDAFTQILQRDTADMEAMARIATSSIRLGDSTTARQMDERLTRLKLPFLMGAPLRWRATIAAAQGRPEDATALLELAVRQGHRLLDTPPNLIVHLDPEFVGIEKWASYQSMLQSLAGGTAAK